MNTNRKYLIAVVGLIGIAQAYWIASRLPEQAATHFDVAGRPNGFMDPAGFFWFMSAMYVTMTAAFTIIPVGWMNIPHKAHWLEPARREATEDYVSRSLCGMGIATHFLMMAAGWMIYDANIAEPPRLNNFLLMLVAAYVLYTFVWTVGFFKRFQK